MLSHKVSNILAIWLRSILNKFGLFKWWLSVNSSVCSSIWYQHIPMLIDYVILYQLYACQSSSMIWFYISIIWILECLKVFTNSRLQDLHLKLVISSIAPDFQWKQIQLLWVFDTFTYFNQGLSLNKISMEKRRTNRVNLKQKCKN